jgi:hypothetical protein
VHLLDVPPEPLAPLPGAVEDREERRQGEPGAVVERLVAGALDPVVAQEVTLFADGLAQDGLEVLRVDDGQVTALYDVLPPGVQPAGPVAPLAADGTAAPEDGLLVPVGRHPHRLDAVGVAEEALGHDRPVEMAVEPVVAGGQAPRMPSGVPGDGRLEQPAVMLDEE